MQDDVRVGCGVHHCAYTGMMGEGAFEHAKERPAGFLLSNKALCHDVLLLEGYFLIFHTKGTDASIPIEGNGLRAVAIVVSLIIRVLRDLSEEKRCQWWSKSRVWRTTYTVKGAIKLLGDFPFNFNVFDLGISPKRSRCSSEILEDGVSPDHLGSGCRSIS